VPHQEAVASCVFIFRCSFSHLHLSFSRLGACALRSVTSLSRIQKRFVSPATLSWPPHAFFGEPVEMFLVRHAATAHCFDLALVHTIIWRGNGAWGSRVGRAQAPPRVLETLPGSPVAFVGAASGSFGSKGLMSKSCGLTSPQTCIDARS
jgi:hypothetical protein